MDAALQNFIGTVTRETLAANPDIALEALEGLVLSNPEIAAAMAEGFLFEEVQAAIQEAAGEQSDAEAELVRPEDPALAPSIIPADNSAAAIFQRYFLVGASNEFFNIAYRNANNEELNFRFSLMPAIESNLSHNTSASYLGGQGARVPEVKPGLLDRLNMKYVRKGIAGSPPAVQSMGIEQRIWQLVGLFLGNELGNPTAMGGYPPTRGLVAFDVADFFTREVVMSGRPVDVTLVTLRPDEDPPQQIRYRAVIQSCRNMHTRSDRTYYAFDLMVTTYYEVQNAAAVPQYDINGEPVSGWQAEPPDITLTPGFDGAPIEGEFGSDPDFSPTLDLPFIGPPAPLIGPPVTSQGPQAAPGVATGRALDSSLNSDLQAASGRAFDLSINSSALAVQPLVAAPNAPSVRSLRRGT